jgi:signal transduction histidine kinase
MCVSPPPSPSQPSPSGPSGRQRGSALLDPSSFELALVALQQRLDQLQQSLSQQNKLATLGMITAVIAHEFNNLLTPMISYTTFALSDKADDALRQKALQKSLAGAQRLANISKSLLGFTRGDESTTANIAAAVRETLACLSRELSKDGITLTMEVPENLCVALNAGHLQQILMNLIVNARSAMLHRTREIQPNSLPDAPRAADPRAPHPSSERRSRADVSATRRSPALHNGATGATGGAARGIKRLTIRALLSPDAKTVELRIADTGPGIPAEVLPRIFDPFFSTKRTATPADNDAFEECMPRGGTGLGLTICQELVHAAGGTIRAINEFGATFILELPVAGEAAPTGAGEAA